MNTLARRLPRVSVHHVTGDIFSMTADAFVNPWNRNFVPRLLLFPQGISGHLKRLTGSEPWKQLARAGTLPLGAAVATSSGSWANTQTLIHVAGLEWTWKASERSVRESTRNAVLCASEHGATTLLMPVIGAGTGGLSAAQARSAILGALEEFSGSAADAVTSERPLRVSVATKPESA